MKVTMTGLPDGKWEQNAQIGKEYVFYNGNMSQLDGRKCLVIEILDKHGKFIVKFDCGREMLAYNTELSLQNQP